MQETATSPESLNPGWPAPRLLDLDPLLRQSQESLEVFRQSQQTRPHRPASEVLPRASRGRSAQPVAAVPAGIRLARSEANYVPCPKIACPLPSSEPDVLPPSVESLCKRCQGPRGHSVLSGAEEFWQEGEVPKSGKP